MRSLGAAHLLVFGLFVVLVLDSRRFRALTRFTGKRRSDPSPRQAIPGGANAERVGIPLRLIQMRIHVDWQDGGLGWEGPEILESDEDGYEDGYEDEPEGDEAAAVAPLAPSLPVLWKPFPALPAAGHTGSWLQPEATPTTTAAWPRSETPVLVGATASSGD